MATPTYDPIASTTLTSSASSVTFSSLDTIAAGYRDLVLVVNATKFSGSNAIIRFNGNSSSIYAWVSMDTANGTVNSGAYSSQPGIYNFGPYHNSNPSTATLQVFDFSATDKHKSVLTRSGEASYYVRAMAGRFGSTAAITSLTIDGDGYTFNSGSVFSLYGIAA